MFKIFWCFQLTKKIRLAYIVIFKIFTINIKNYKQILTKLNFFSIFLHKKLQKKNILRTCFV